MVRESSPAWGLGTGTSLVLSCGVQAWRCGHGQLERMTEDKDAAQRLLIHVLNTHSAQTLLETQDNLYPGLYSFVWQGVRIACKSWQRASKVRPKVGSKSDEEALDVL